MGLIAGLMLAAAPATAAEYDARACAPAQAAPASPQAARARATLLKALHEDHGGGIQAAVMQDGRLVWSEAVGRAGFWPDQPLTRATQMRIGSVSKLFTAIAAARLAEAGRLDVDAPIQRYVPEFPAKGATITARQLASHTSGLRQYDFASLRESNSTVHYARLSDALKVFAADPLVNRPGARFHYSSLGFNLLGVAVERASGQAFPEAVATLVTRPLGMGHSGIDDRTATLACRTAFSTVAFGWLRIPAPPRDASDYYPSGGMLSTAEDLARMADATMRGEGAAPGMRSLFTTPARLANGQALDRGFGWEIGRDAAGRVVWYGHGGTTNGAYASVRYYPAQRITVAAVANYNLWLTDRAPAVLRVARKDLPEVFGVELGS